MRLTEAERAKLEDRDFAIASRRAYPIPDRIHARLALDMVEAHGTPRERREVRAAVKARFPGLDLPRK